jgi:acetyl esterase/lipase
MTRAHPLCVRLTCRVFRRPIVVVAAYDALCDEGLFYAERLRSAGGHVTVRRYDDMVHGFFTMVNILDTGTQALREVARDIGDTLQRPRTGFGTTRT